MLALQGRCCHILSKPRLCLVNILVPRDMIGLNAGRGVFQSTLVPDSAIVLIQDKDCLLADNYKVLLLRDVIRMQHYLGSLFSKVSNPNGLDGLLCSAALL